MPYYAGAPTSDPGYYANYQAGNALSSWDQNQAQASYYNALASGVPADKALAQAKFEWQKKLDEANQTGMWNGQWNNPQEQWYTGQFGQWYGPGGAPNVGDQTLTAQQQAQGNAQAWSGMFGQYYAPGTAPTQGASTLAAQTQANTLGLNQGELTGWYTDPSGQRQQTLAGQNQQYTQGFQQQQFAAQQQQLQQQNALAYLGQLSQLRGPADWAKYQQVLGSTPQGMRDLYAAAMGQYTPGGGATTGYQPQAANLNTMQQQIAGQYGQQQPGNAQWYSQPGFGQGEQRGASGEINAQGQFVANPAMAQRGPAWGSGIGVGQQGATADQQVQATGNGTNMYGGQQQQYNLPAPNQIAAQSWQNMAPSQQQMLLGQYEANGWDKNDVQALYNQSLPKYGQNSPGAGTWRLQ